MVRLLQPEFRVPAGRRSDPPFPLPQRPLLLLIPPRFLSHSPEDFMTTLMNEAVTELVAIGVAMACNCEPCFKHHFNRLVCP